MMQRTSARLCVRFGVVARQAMLTGADRAVTTTLGPKGRDVIIDQPGGDPKITKDGVTAAKAIEFADPFENKGAQFFRQVCSKTNDLAGDGTTTTAAAVLVAETASCLTNPAGQPVPTLNGGETVTAATTCSVTPVAFDVYNMRTFPVPPSEADIAVLVTQMNEHRKHDAKFSSEPPVTKDTDEINFFISAWRSGSLAIMTANHPLLLNRIPPQQVEVLPKTMVDWKQRQCRTLYGTHLLDYGESFSHQTMREEDSINKITVSADIPLVETVRSAFNTKGLRVAVINGASGAGKSVAALRIANDGPDSVTLYAITNQFLPKDVRDACKRYADAAGDEDEQAKLRQSTADALVDRIAKVCLANRIDTALHLSPCLHLYVVLDEMGEYLDVLRVMCAVGRSDVLSAGVAKHLQLHQSADRLRVRLILVGTGLASFRFDSGSAAETHVQLFTAASDSSYTVFTSLMKNVANGEIVAKAVLQHPTVAAAVCNPRIARFFARRLQEQGTFINSNNEIAAPILYAKLFHAIDSYKEKNALRMLNAVNLLDAISGAVRLHFFPYSFASSPNADAPPSAGAYGLLADVAEWRPTSAHDLTTYATVGMTCLSVTNAQGSRFQLSPAIIVIVMKVILGSFSLSSDVSGSGLELGAMTILFLMGLAAGSPAELGQLLKCPTHYFRTNSSTPTAAAGANRERVSAVFSQCGVPELGPSNALELVALADAALKSATDEKQRVAAERELAKRQAELDEEAQLLKTAVLGSFADRNTPYVGAWVSGATAPFADVVVRAHKTLILGHCKSGAQVGMQAYEVGSELYKMGDDCDIALCGYIAATCTRSSWSAVLAANIIAAEQRGNFVESGAQSLHFPNNSTNSIKRSALFDALGGHLSRDDLLAIIKQIKANDGVAYTAGERSKRFVDTHLKPIMDCDSVHYAFFADEYTPAAMELFKDLAHVSCLTYKQFGAGGPHNLLPHMSTVSSKPIVVDVRPKA